MKLKRGRNKLFRDGKGPKRAKGDMWVPLSIKKKNLTVSLSPSLPMKLLIFITFALFCSFIESGTHILNVIFFKYLTFFRIFFKIFVLWGPLDAYRSNFVKIRLSQNSTKFDWVTRFRETNSTMKSVSSSEI